MYFNRTHCIFIYLYMYVVKINSCEQIKNNFTDYYIFVMLTLSNIVLDIHRWNPVIYQGSPKFIGHFLSFTANLIFDVPGKR